MSKPKQPDPVVTSAGTTIAVAIPGTDRTYTLRAPTYGEVGRMTARALTAVAPSDAIFAEALRKVIEGTLPEADRAAALAVVDAFEEATDHLESLYGVHGTDRTAWDADAKRELREAERALMTARRGRNKLEWQFRDHADLLALRRTRIDANQLEAQELVVLCVCGVGEALAQLTPDDVLALPAGDVAVLTERAQAMIRPTAAAEKN